MGKPIKNPPPSEGKRVAIYGRKSDLATESKGRSCTQQVDACILAAKGLSLEVSDRLIFKEEDGNKGWYFWEDSEKRNPPPYRVELGRLVAEIEAGNVDIVMVWRTDRLYRDEMVASTLLRKFIQHGVRLFSRGQDLAIHTASGYQNALTEAVANRAYSDKIGEDIKRQHLTNAQNGLLTRDPSMFGFRSAGKGTLRAVPQWEEIAVIRRIYTMYVFGEDGHGPMSARGIAQRLMDDGIQLAVGAKNHKCKDRSHIHAGQITSILRNQAYVGILKHDDKLYPTNAFNLPCPDGSGNTETVIQYDLFERAQEILNGVWTYPKRDKTEILAGLVVCPCCGRKQYAMSRGQLSRNLFCPYRIGRYRNCWGKEYRTLKVETLTEWAKIHLAPLIAAEIVALKAERNGEPLRREIAGLERKAAQLLTAETETLAQYMLSGLTPSQVAAVGAKFKRDREDIELRLADLRLRSRRETSEIWNPLDLVSEDEATTRQALHRAIKWIAVTKHGVVVFTRDDSVIGARLVPGPKKANGKGGHRLPVLKPPTVEATKECLNWIENPEAMLAGLRTPSSWNKRQVPDNQLMPAALLERIGGRLAA